MKNAVRKKAWMAVMPAYQKRGVGRILMEHGISLARKNGKQAIRVDALASNLPAHHLYKRLGFAYRDKKHLYAENTGWTDFLFFERKIDERSV